MAISGHSFDQAASSPPIDLTLLDAVLARYSHERGALIPVLQQVQQIYGYLPKEALALIARRLGVSVSKVYGVATFYAQFYFEPRGRHILRLCDGTACHVKGTPKLLTALGDTLHLEPGQTSEDGALTLEIVYCLGSCALAPVAVLDGQVMGRVKQDALLRRVQRTVHGER